MRKTLALVNITIHWPQVSLQTHIFNRVVNNFTDTCEQSWFLTCRCVRTLRHGRNSVSVFWTPLLCARWITCMTFSILCAKRRTPYLIVFKAPPKHLSETVQISGTHEICNIHKHGANLYHWVLHNFHRTVFKTPFTSCMCGTAVTLILQQHRLFFFVVCRSIHIITTQHPIGNKLLTTATFFLRISTS